MKKKTASTRKLKKEKKDCRKKKKKSRKDVVKRMLKLKKGEEKKIQLDGARGIDKQQKIGNKN